MKNSLRNKLVTGMLVVLFAAIILVWFIYNNLGLYPIRNLPISQIESISIYSLSLEEKEVLSEEEKKELLSYLSKVELKGKGTQEFKEYDGGKYLMFQLNLKDSSNIDFAASNPFYIINIEKGYKADYGLCGKISRLYYSMLDKHFK
ncbi:MAG: hypothetical protein K0R05_351 [Anaerocolumna sp.]|jgi:hypothetical protein|nr:hypothetical protein [Anaerocolumna sp.]